MLARTAAPTDLTMELGCNKKTVIGQSSAYRQRVQRRNLCAEHPAALDVSRQLCGLLRCCRCSDTAAEPDGCLAERTKAGVNTCNNTASTRSTIPLYRCTGLPLQTEQGPHPPGLPVKVVGAGGVEAFVAVEHVERLQTACQVANANA